MSESLLQCITVYYSVLKRSYNLIHLLHVLIHTFDLHLTGEFVYILS